MTPQPPLDAAPMLAHAAWVRALARHLARPGTSAEDLEQDAWVAALEHRPSDVARVRPWFARVLSNLARERARGDRHRGERERRAARPEACDEDVLERAGLHRALVEHVLALDEPYRATLLLRYFDELSPSEIAARQRVPVRTVKTRLARGLEQLRARLDRSHGGRASWLSALMPLYAGNTSAPLALGATGMGLKWGAVAALAACVCAIGWWSVAGDASVSPPASHARAESDVTDDPSSSEVADVAPRETRTGIAEAPDRDFDDASTTPDARAFAAMRLRGRVTDRRGTPIADATVSVLPSEFGALAYLDGLRRGNAAPLAEIRCDASGGFEFELARHASVDLVVSAPRGYAPERVADRHAGEYVEVRLGASASLGGRVVHADDRSACADALVRLTRVGGRDAAPGESWSTRTDASGSYVLTEIAPGDLHVHVTPRAAVPVSYERVTLAEGEAGVHDVAVERGGSLTGRVTAAETKLPISGAEIRVHGVDEPRAVTAADGTYRVPGIDASAAQVMVTARADGYADLARQIHGPTSGVQTLDLELEIGRTARGRIVDAQGRPVAGASVLALAMAVDGRMNPRLEVSTRSALDGRFELAHMAPGFRPTLYVEKEGYGALGVDFPDESPEVTDFGDLVLSRPASLRGRVVREDGSAVADVGLLLRGPSGLGMHGDPPLNALLVARRETRADAHGRFGFAGLGAGEYVIELVASNQVRSVQATVRVAAGNDLDEFELLLPTRSSLAGRVLDRRGRAVTRSAVNLYREPLDGRRLAWTMTDGEGRFEFHGLEDGEYALRVWAESGVPGTSEHEVGTFERRVRSGRGSLEVLLVPSGLLFGSVVDAAGDPIPNVRVTARDAESPAVVPVAGEVLTPNDGSFTLAVPRDALWKLEATVGEKRVVRDRIRADSKPVVLEFAR